MALTMYKELNLPPFIKDTSTLNLLKEFKKNKTERAYVYTTRDVKYFISDELHNIFKSLNVYPHVMVAFGHIDNPNIQHDKPILHSDVTFEKGQWLNVPCALNYELTNTQATFEWWNTGTDVHLFPTQPPINIDQEYTNGVHYGKRGNNNVSRYSCIGSYVLDNNHPILIRPEIPHTVRYTKGYNSRVSISLRFPFEQIPTWEKALEVFSLVP